MKYIVGDRSFRKLERALKYAHRLYRKYGWEVHIEKYENKEQVKDWLHGKKICTIRLGKEYWYE
jgi:hypothetical protein